MARSTPETSAGILSQVAQNSEKQRERFTRNFLDELRREIDYTQIEMESLWGIEDLFAQSLYQLSQDRCGIGVVFHRDIAAKMDGDSGFRLEVIVEESDDIERPSGLPMDTIALGRLKGKELTVPFDIAEAHHGRKRQIDSSINENVVPFLIEFFKEAGFTVIQRDMLFVPDKIFEEKQKGDPSLKSQVFSPTD